MTRDGFKSLLAYLAPRCGKPDEAQSRALWEDLADWADAPMLAAAKAWCLGQWGHKLPTGGQLAALAGARRSEAGPTPPAMLERYTGRSVTDGCPFHEPDDPACARTIAAQAIPFIEGAQSRDAAKAIAVEAIQQIGRMNGVRVPEALR